VFPDNFVEVRAATKLVRSSDESPSSYDVCTSFSIVVIVLDNSFLAVVCILLVITTLKITKIIIGTATEIASIDDNNCLYIVLILHLLF